MLKRDLALVLGAFLGSPYKLIFNRTTGIYKILISSFSLEFAFNNAHFDDSCNLHLILDNQAWVLRLEEYENNIKILKLQNV